MQTLKVVQGDELRVVLLAGPGEDVIPGIRWGDAAELLTPAYWALRSSLRDTALDEVAGPALTLVEEVAFCLLGGFGVTAEMAQAFFERLRLEGMFEAGAAPTEAELRSLLDERLSIGKRLSKYRYPAQRARRLASELPLLSAERFRTSDPLRLREELLTLEGVGPKTASWIVRNWLQANDVAILDIHVVRACQIMKVFPAEVCLPRGYAQLEGRFLEFARGIGVSPAKLDAIMWSEMRTFSPRLLARLT